MADQVKVKSGPVQETLFIPLAARARETRRRRPVLRDPKAAKILASVDFDTNGNSAAVGGGSVAVSCAPPDLRVLGQRLPGRASGRDKRGDRRRAESQVGPGRQRPGALGTSLDLPDAIELRRRFFTESSRRRMVAASVLEQDWLPALRDSPGPYFFAAEGVLAYLEQASTGHTGPRRGSCPGALDRFRHLQPAALEQRHRLAAKPEHGCAIGSGRATSHARWNPSALRSCGGCRYPAARRTGQCGCHADTDRAAAGPPHRGRPGHRHRLPGQLTLAVTPLAESVAAPGIRPILLSWRR